MRDKKGRFIKGNKHSTKIKNKIGLKGRGRIVSKETRRKISIGHKGKKKPWVKNTHWKGKNHTEESRKKMSVSAKGKKLSEETKEKISLSLRGKMPKNLISLWETNRGKNHPNWKGGITEERDRLKHSVEYKLWRKSVFERDNYTCRFCGQIGGKLNADHIKPWCDYPELRFAIDNERTLCEDCHRKTDTYGARLFYPKY
jgi:rubrerythrin